MSHYLKHVFLCTNQKTGGKVCCANSGGDAFFEHFKDRLLELELYGQGKIRISKSGCLGRCSSGPCLVIYPEGIWYRYESIADIEAIIDSHLIHDTPVARLLVGQ